MGNVIAFCEFQEGQLRTSALANIAFARQAAQAHGGEVIALLVGAGAQAASAHAAKFAPKVIVGKSVTLPPARKAGQMVKTVEELVKKLHEEAKVL